MKNLLKDYLQKLVSQLSSLKSQVSSQRGFSLIELIIYVAIMSILVVVLCSTFASILEVQTDSKATSSVDQDSRYIIAKLNYDMQSASSIVAPAVGSQSAALQLSINTATQSYALSNGNLQLTKNSQADNLNSTNTSISNLTFKRLGTGTANDTIRVQFTMTSLIKRTANKTETKTFTTTIGKQ
jgi:prepilin-type N-terminal cleavage/methylation domain-containing protein